MFLKIDSVTIFDKELLNDSKFFNTNINLSKIEDFINNILDKHNDLCKYYFNINENYWSVSFKVGIDQIDVMCKSTFEINLYKNEHNSSVITISNEINEYEQWEPVCRDLIKALKK
jgi:hypothetical protein